MVLDTALLYTQHNKVRIKGKVSSPTPWCGSYWKGSFLGHPQLKGDNLTYFVLQNDTLSSVQFYVKTEGNQLFRCFSASYILFSDSESSRLIWYVEVGLVMKPRHLTSWGNIFVIHPFLTHCPCRFSYFSKLRWYAKSIFSSKGTVNSTTKTFLKLTAQMTISERWVINVISVGNANWDSKSVPTCQSVQQSNSDEPKVAFSFPLGTLGWQTKESSILW